VKRTIHKLGAEAKILDLGSGTDRRAPNVITLEIEAGSNVDVIGDGHQLPFHDNAFDAIISEAVLEHVLEPKQVVAEIYRVLKPGGYVCAAVPFLQGFHASPHDYQRYTVPGFNHLFSAFMKIESGACAGPTASLHWIFREYAGLVFSFGNLLAAKIISLIIGWLTFPIILIDYLLMINKHSHILASAVYFVGRKEETTKELHGQK
jgi:SAM-dependent methyltransferase